MVYTKEYKGQHYRVIAEGGKYYLGSTHGKVFKSLSGAAQEITGHPTSGKGFFGLLKQSEPQAETVEAS